MAEVARGTSTLSELEIKKIIDEDDTCTVTGVTLTEDDRLVGMSQNSPVNSAKHSQIKSSPIATGIQVPLLQSIMSQMSKGGLGVGVATKIGEDDEEGRGVSQSIPVHPGKHSQTGNSPSMKIRIHSPLMQLRSHGSNGELVGETRMEVGASDDEAKDEVEAKDELEETNDTKVVARLVVIRLGVENGSKSLSELEITNRTDVNWISAVTDVVVAREDDG